MRRLLLFLFDYEDLQSEVHQKVRLMNLYLCSYMILHCQGECLSNDFLKFKSSKLNVPSVHLFRAFQEIKDFLLSGNTSIVTQKVE